MIRQKQTDKQEDILLEQTKEAHWPNPWKDEDDDGNEVALHNLELNFIYKMLYSKLLI